MRPGEAALARWSATVNAELRRVFSTLPATSIFDVMRYQLGWQDGHPADYAADSQERILGGVCLLSCTGMSGDVKKALPTAGCLELVRSFTHLHDDMEQNARTTKDERRPAAWTVWGIPQTINAGDGMHTLAKVLLAEDAEGRVSSSELVMLSRLVDEALLKLHEGQFLDLQLADVEALSPERYFSVEGMRLGALLACAAQCGALLGGAGPAVQDRFRQFGQSVGLGWSINQDILCLSVADNAEGTPRTAISARWKKMLPIAYACAELSGARRDELRRLLAAEAIDAARLRDLLQACDALQWSQAQADNYLERGLAELDKTGIENDAHQDLKDLARLLATNR